MSTNLANFLFELINFGLLAGGLGWLLFKPVRAAIEAEQQRHKEEAAAITTRRASIDEGEQDLKRRQTEFEQQIDAERQRLLEDAREQAKSIVAESRSSAHKLEEQISAEREKSRGALVAELSDSLALVVSDALRRLLESLEGPALDLALVRVACDELDGMATTGTERAIVECARPLSDDARALLGTHLPQGFELRDAPGLSAGVRVTTSRGQIDASGLALTRHAAAEVGGAIVEVEAADDAAV